MTEHHKRWQKVKGHHWPAGALGQRRGAVDVGVVRLDHDRVAGYPRQLEQHHDYDVMQDSSQL